MLLLDRKAFRRRGWAKRVLSLGQTLYTLGGKAEPVKRYYWLVIVVAAALGALTMAPLAPARKPNLLGYYSHCPLAPVTTLIWWAIAGAVYWLGKRGEKT
jgi:hypothetical protein